MEKKKSERLELLINAYEKKKKGYEARKTYIPSIPNFWMEVFSKDPTFKSYITDTDKQILKSLTSFEVLEDPSNESEYSFVFDFQANEYFDKTRIVKSYAPSKDNGNSDLVGEVKNEIEWKPGMVPHGINENNLIDRKAYTGISFFTWFCEDVSADNKETMHVTLKNEIWPNAWDILIDNAHEIVGVVAADVVKEMDLIQKNIKEFQVEEDYGLEKIDKNYRQSMTKWYAERNEVTKDINKFWLNVFLSHKYFKPYACKEGFSLNKNDVKIFEHLISIEVKDEDVGASEDSIARFAKYAVIFKFKKNEYFVEDQLKKTFFYGPDQHLKKVESSRITWNTGKIADIVPPSSRAKRASKMKTQAKAQSCDFRASFFQWFSTSERRSHLDIEDEFLEYFKEEIINTPMKIIGETFQKKKKAPQEEEAPDDDDAGQHHMNDQSY